MKWGKSMISVEQQKKVNEIALEILNMCRNSLIVNLRFISSAVSALQLKNVYSIDTTATDGENYYYNPFVILKNYKTAKELPCRQYLHTLFHCIYRHMFIGNIQNERYWDIACDIAVENSINGLSLGIVDISRIKLQNDEIAELSKEIKYITAEMIYRHFLNTQPSEERMSKLENIFKMDNHDTWHKKNNGNNTDNDFSDNDSPNIDSNGNRSGSENNSDNNLSDNDSQNDDFNGNRSDRGISSHSTNAVEQRWQDISEYIQTAFETLEKDRGDKAGSLMQNLLEVNRERYDYSSFLKKFAVMGETMQINDDEFDYIFYTYGLQLYRKMPLIEPLEYKEVKRIKEFVIAIDTSGSVSGELVKKFVTKTYNILKSTESFFSKINLHIIQCDAEIQTDVKITSQEELDNYIKNMTLHGFGGTDFRPVFKYVDMLIEKHEFVNLKGLIYFTDGFGIFPERQPNYYTAFAHVYEGYENPDVPVWAIKLILQPEEI